MELAESLAPLAGLDLSAHAAAMFAAKADISHLTPRELVLMDSKVKGREGRGRCKV